MKSTIFALALAGFSFAAPVQKRDDTTFTDADIINYALTLEHLENTFYSEGLHKFTESDFAHAGYGPEVYANIKEIAFDEHAHVQFLTAALTAAGAAPVQQCTYNFGITSVDSFLMTASILEGVGVSAYTGAAGRISNPDYITAAASILTIEARHNAYVRSELDQSPFPQAFDTPLGFNQVYSLAAPFFVSCPPTNPAFLDLVAFPGLAVTHSEEQISNGDVITVESATLAYTGDVYAAFMTATGPVWTEVVRTAAGSFNVKVPAGLSGQNYLVLTNAASGVTDATTVAGPAIVEVCGTDGGN